jgi:hypothetical protein
MRVSRVLTTKTTSISGTEIDLFTIRRYRDTLRMKYIKKHNMMHCSFTYF